MSFTEYNYNEYDFSEVTDGTGLGDAQPLVTNGEGRDALPFEIILNSAEPYYCGEIRDADGIADTESGRINIEHRRVIRTSQILTTATFAVGDKVYFKPGGSGAAGQIVDAANKAAGSIEFGFCEGFGGSAGAHTYIEVRPLAYDASRALES